MSHEKLTRRTVFACSYVGIVAVISSTCLDRRLVTVYCGHTVVFRYNIDVFGDNVDVKLLRLLRKDHHPCTNP